MYDDVSCIGLSFLKFRMLVASFLELQPCRVTFSQTAFIIDIKSKRVTITPGASPLGTALISVL